MQKVMIVEDNIATQEGICENINWIEHDIDIIAAKANGYEAIEQLKVTVPDVIITDIVMPIVDGLELIRLVKGGYPDIKVIILSAYEEFEYAQEALKLGVFDYIMKPFDYNQLLNAVLRALDEKKQDDVFKEQVKKSIPVLRDKFLLQLIEEDYDDLVFMDDAKYLGLKFEDSHYICVLFDIDNIKQIKSKMKMEKFNIQLLRINNIISGNFSDMTILIFRIKNNSLAAIIGFGNEDVSSIYYKLYDKLECVRKEVEKSCELTISIGIGSFVSPICNIGQSFRKAQNVLEYKFIMGNNRIFNAKDMELTAANDHIYFPLSIEERFIKKVCFGNIKEATDCINELIEYFKAHNVDGDYIKTTVLGLVTKMFQSLYEWGIKTEKITISRIKIYKEIQELDAITNLFTWLEDLVIKICNEVEACMLQQHQMIVYKAMDFIDRSYMDEELNLNLIAKEVSLSPTYLSGIFKKVTGTNISEYILKIRIEKAQELLRNTDLKISDVSIQVGYSNQFYFSTCFKKYTGQTPNEFRSKRN